MSNNSLPKFAILFLCVISLLLLALGYGMWKKREQSAVYDYKMYMSSQCQILNLLQAALDMKDKHSDFVGRLMLAKGEFTYLDPIINHVSMPKSIIEFHELGKNLVDEILTKTSKGKLVQNDISKLEDYTKKLRRMVRTLGLFTAENESASDIYKRLDEFGRNL
ncbi:hypothetical protein Tfer_3280 [Thermincola ferriacetica]|uniref:Uncharacterized protein n=1 Tax=Thermincola ferriacetica TaxID=281456 RepID=A0A0L6VY52_9FIRM|nr:hypothetical protein [Thermincola ferriacetica]KNZ68185.1 hypothetical protein Tfer_3280 [Thermincola ferriacetica]